MICHVRVSYIGRIRLGVPGCTSLSEQHFLEKNKYKKQCFTLSCEARNT